MTENSATGSRPSHGWLFKAGALARRYGLLLPPLVIYLRGVTAFPFSGAEVRFSDLVISHLPNLLYLRRSLLHWQTVPLWSPLIHSGAPFGANPLSGLWYPPGWLPLILPVPLGFNLTVAAHVLWGGVGLVRLLRSLGLGARASALGGMLFVAMPKVAAHYGAGHLTLLYAVPWTPWLLWVTCRALEAQPSGRFDWRPGALLALIFLADVRWAVYAGILWLAWIGAHRRHFPVRFRDLRASAGWSAVHLALAAGLSACLALPLLEYVRLSTRGTLTVAEALVFSLPPPRLLGMLFPDFGGFSEWVLYAGGPTLILGGIGVLAAHRERRVWFFAGLAAFSTLFALGEHLPGLESMVRLPGLSLLRVPPRALFLTGLALAVLAAHGAQALLEDLGPAQIRRVRLWLVGVTAFGLAVAGLVIAISGDRPINFIWGAGALLLTTLWVSARSQTRSRGSAWFTGLVLLCLLDLVGVGVTVLSPRPAGEVWSEDRGLATFLSRNPGLFRVYSPSYSLAQQAAARFGLELADGVDPLQIADYADYFQQASGVPLEAYSVTLPPLPGDDISSANAGVTPDPSLLGRLNVQYVAAEFPLTHSDLRQAARIGHTYVYENLAARPRAWVQEGLGEAEVWRPVERVVWTPNSITVAARGPGTLVLSEIAYPGWGVTVDGAPGEESAAAGPLRAVHLPAGNHLVVYRFRPLSVFGGLAITLGTVAIIFFLNRWKNNP